MSNEKLHSCHLISMIKNLLIDFTVDFCLLCINDYYQSNNVYQNVVMIPLSYNHNSISLQAFLSLPMSNKIPNTNLVYQQS